MKSLLKRLLAGQGYKLHKIPSAHAIERLVEPGSYRRLRALIKHYKVNHVLDVGAFQGQFGCLLIHTFNYQGKITSFEPVTSFFQQLKQSARPFQDRWRTLNLALGNTCGEATIQIAGNAYSSSLLPMLAQHEAAAPGSAYIEKQTIQIATLDSLLESVIEPKDNLYLKVDVQGFERQVLAGAQHSLAKISTVQLEVSLVELYQGETLLNEMLDYMHGLRFDPVLLIPGFANEQTGELLQVDVVFHRHS
jgi:FkbM family methyltransferase